MFSHFIVTWLVTAVSLLILSKLPLGIEIDDFGTALVSALVLGLLNAFVRPVLAFLAFPITVLTLGLFTFILNAIIFWLAAALVDGFRLRGGWLAALIGPIALGLLNGLLLALIR